LSDRNGLELSTASASARNGKEGDGYEEKKNGGFVHGNLLSVYFRPSIRGWRAVMRRMLLDWTD